MTSQARTYAPAAGNDRHGGGPADGKTARLAANWWAILLRGAIGILFGIVAFVLPGVALQTLILLFAVYMLADGVLAILSAVRAARAHERWGWLIVEGVLDLLAGVTALLLPAVAALTFVLLASAWAIVSGIALLIASFRLHRAHGRWLMALSGILSLAWGILLLVLPISGALVLTWWIGAYALVFGVMLVALALRLRHHRHPRRA